MLYIDDDMMGWRWALVALLLLLVAAALWFGAETTENKSSGDGRRNGAAFVLACDAGSSGTRFYLFPRDADAEDVPSAALLKSETAALQEQTPETALDYVRPGLARALESVPEGATVDRHVYGTAGMRLAEESLQEGLYSSLRLGAASFELDDGDNHRSKQLIAGEMRTLRGDEEGFFAVLAVNYLTGKLTKDLRPTGSSNTFNNELHGALDLGGSSTQLIYAKSNDANSTSAASNLRINASRKRPPPLSPEDFFVHSYSNYGANRMREILLNRWAEQTESKAQVWQHPCSFRGDTLSIDGRSWEGSGKGRDCIDFIESLVAEGNRNCPSEQPQQSAPAAPNDVGCALDSVPHPPPAPGTRFYAFGVYCCATRFAHDVMSHYYSVSDGSSLTPTPLHLPNPTLHDLERSTEWICALEADEVHRPTTPMSLLTTPEQVYRRCFDLAYIVVLMRRLRATATEEEDAANVNFVADIGGRKVSWTLGAYLLIMAREKNEKQSLVAATATAHRFVGWMCGCALAILVGRRCRQLRSFRFPKGAND